MSDITDPRSNGAGKIVSSFNRLDLSRGGANTIPLWKIALDKLGAAVLLLFFAPFFLIIAAVLKLREGGPILFAHERIGLNGRRFRCLKFRTMVPDARERLEALLAADPVARREWEQTQKLTDDPRISCLGDTLRRTSLDELPQLFNVLRGEMSLVGPRPIVEDEQHHYGENFREYLSVRPGLTGLWQVSGRSNTTYPERVAMDVEYVRNHSLWSDLRILLRTVRVVLFRDGAC
ncbi:sugar transferase [Acidimangrovimonas pyrenivorans]|uniref:Sugar transferase n=1 Tax=Acidimangrovimonas pyrenivorans TaxID=2030798 RepID=A0ABV7AC44_9RHOB